MLSINIKVTFNYFIISYLSYYIADKINSVNSQKNYLKINNNQFLLLCDHYSTNYLDWIKLS
jgi:hypothetical protein